MNVKIVAVGKLKKSCIREGVSDYCKRLSKYVKIDIIEVKDEKLGDKASEADGERVRKKEGERLLSAIGRKGDKSFVVCLDVKGEQFSTEKLTEFIVEKKHTGVKELFFVIGGHLGLCLDVIKRADALLSLSGMTFPHELARLILVEQLYRAEKIINREPYHK